MGVPGPLTAAAAARGAAWLAAVAVATGLGLVAVNTVGDAARGRGPLGPAVVRVDSPLVPEAPVSASPRPGTTVVERALEDEFGTFVVSCQGPFPLGLDAVAAPGWSVVRFEPGPDDDVEAIFASDTEFVEIEVYCNQGVPTVGELDRSQVKGSAR